jgi:hypothetical protein
MKSLQLFPSSRNHSFHFLSFCRLPTTS